MKRELPYIMNSKKLNSRPLSNLQKKGLESVSSCGSLLSELSIKCENNTNSIVKFPILFKKRLGIFENSGNNFLRSDLKSNDFSNKYLMRFL